MNPVAMSTPIAAQSHTVTMPDLAQSHYGFHHTVDSALEIFASLGIASNRITISMAGRGLPSRWVASQRPAAGTAIASGDTIELQIAGLGYFHHLPVAMWDTGGESELGTREITSVLDDPYQKAAHWLREGARLFDISATNLDACARFITLFGLNPEDWPTTSWYNLAILLPSLQSLAGKENGMRFALNLMLGLPLETIRRKRRYLYMTEDELSLTGERMSRLGVDLIVGDHVEDLAQLTMVLGPVSLDTFYAFQSPDQKSLLNAVLYLVTAAHQRCTVAWSILDRNRAPQLGVEECNARLGLNSHLGASLA